MSVIKLEQNNFNEVIAKGVTLVDFYADWCGPCKMIAPIVEQVATETDAQVGKLNVDLAQGVAQQFGVMSIPTLIVFKDGKEVERVVGFTAKENLLRMIQNTK